MAENQIILMTQRQKKHQSIFFYGLIVLVWVLPFNLLWSSWVFIFLVLNWLIEADFYAKWQRLRHRPQALFFMAFFMIHLLSYFYTDNLKAFGGHIEKKIAFLGYPMILASTMPLSSKQVRVLLKMYVLGILAAMTVCLGVATKKFLHAGDTSFFFYHELSQVIGLNAIYMATYLSFAAFIVLHFLLSDWKTSGIIYRSGTVLILSALMIFIVLLSSKTILISFPLLLNIFLLVYLFTQKNYQLGLGLLAFNILLAILFFTLEYPQQRFKEVLATDFGVIFKDKVTYEENNQLTGVSVRLLLWRFAGEILNEKQSWLTGLGIGDAQDALNHKIEAANLYTGDQQRGDTGYIGYNCHNQYVEFTLILGLIGLIYYIVYLGILFKIAVRMNNLLFIFFVCLITTICFSESFLETNKGIIFFNLFVGLFVFHGRDYLDSRG